MQQLGVSLNAVSLHDVFEGAAGLAGSTACLERFAKGFKRAGASCLLCPLDALFQGSRLTLIFNILLRHTIHPLDDENVHMVMELCEG